MTIRQYIVVMIFATLLCWTALVLVVLNVDPFQANWLSLTFFYLSLFLSFLGTSSILFFFLLQLTRRAVTPMFRHVAKSFHLGFLGAAALTILMYFLGRGWLQVWNTIIFLAALLSFTTFLFFHRRGKVAANSNLNLR